MGRPGHDRSRLAESAPSFPPGTKHTYHALTIGWLVCEIVRRVDGRSIGRFFADEFAGPFGLEVWIGLPGAELPRKAYIYDPPRPSPQAAPHAEESILAAARDPEKLIGRAFVGNGSASPLDDIEPVFNNPDFVAEVPAGNGIATARAMPAVGR